VLANCHMMLDISRARGRTARANEILRETTISARAAADRYGISRERVRQIAERDGVSQGGWQKARQARGLILARKRELVRERGKRRKERQNLEAAQLRALVKKDGVAVREAGRRLFPTLTRSKAERLAKEFGIISARGMRWVKLLSLSQIPPSKQIAFSLPTGVRWASLM
jgi:hypothetical protein